eukprot:CAMPEP_0170546832 /NCGR_PEP_ID=MMETSP0211-20121228/5164_1 /TAXON_ID=311385 /ORGANISM="Pseudokeronopsis sp., Strain OXSARD2" /LENGTH=39 /DNA_ID= /DNA_START= /DNA_END= /DNA_ORIENTATION=
MKRTDRKVKNMIRKRNIEIEVNQDTFQNLNDNQTMGFNS